MNLKTKSRQGRFTKAQVKAQANKTKPTTHVSENRTAKIICGNVGENVTSDI